MRQSASSWAFGGKDERRDAFDREQAALAAIERADPEFARVLTRKLVPDRPAEERDVIRRVVR